MGKKVKKSKNNVYRLTRKLTEINFYKKIIFLSFSKKQGICLQIRTILISLFEYYDNNITGPD